MDLISFATTIVSTFAVGVLLGFKVGRTFYTEKEKKLLEKLYIERQDNIQLENEKRILEGMIP